MPAELKERLGQLAKRQADLASRVEPFAQKIKAPTQSPLPKPQVIGQLAS